MSMRGLAVAGCMLWAHFLCAGELELTVLDAATGKAITNASVVVRADGGYPAGGVQTGADGQCSVWTDAGQSYVSLLVRHDGHVTTSVSWHGDDRVVQLPPAVTVKLPTCKTISGRVVDPEGEPVPDAKVYLEYWPDGSVKDQPSVMARLPDEMVESDAGGVWVYSGAPTDALDRLTIRVEHPDFVSNKGAPVPPAAALLDGTATTKLDRGVDVTGRVLTADGKPVASAHISTQQCYYVSNDHGIKTDADGQGRFTLPHMAAGELPVTVTAKGFSPELQMVEVKPGMKPLSFTLSPGRTAKGIVVDAGGKPVAGARVSMDDWRNLSSISWQTITSADGRFQMPDAPVDAFTVRVSKQGYGFKVGAKVRPADAETTITLSSDVHVKGAVTDAATGKPIERFRVIPGYAQWDGRPGFWFSRAREFAGGTYDQVISDGGSAAFVRVEAERYQPFVSAPIKDADATANATLERGHDLTGIVRDPEGKPLAGVDVYAVLPGAQVNVDDGRMQRLDYHVPKVQTDSSGGFRLSPQIGSFDILIVADSGYSIVPMSADQKEIEVKLSPWSSMEGTYAPTGEAAQQSLYVMLKSERDDLHDPGPRYFWTYQLSTDAQGHYRVNRLPYGDGQMRRVTIVASGIGVADRRELPVALKPGEVTRLDITVAGTSRLTGRIASANGEKAITVFHGLVDVVPAGDQPIQQPRTTAETFTRYSDRVRSDGSFAITALRPGRYEYSVSISSGTEYACVSGMVTVPSDMVGKDVDLGVLTYDRRKADVGQELPKVLGRTEDGRPIKTEAFAGKYAAVVIWDSGRQADTHLPYLEKLAETFGKSEKVALISINIDAVFYQAKRSATIPGSAWVQGRITTQDKSVMNYLFSEKQPTILIAGPDGKILAKDLAGSEVADRLTQLLARSQATPSGP